MFRNKYYSEGQSSIITFWPTLSTPPLLRGRTNPTEGALKNCVSLWFWWKSWLTLAPKWVVSANNFLDKYYSGGTPATFTHHYFLLYTIHPPYIFRILMKTGGKAGLLLSHNAVRQRKLGPEGPNSLSTNNLKIQMKCARLRVT